MKNLSFLFIGSLILLSCNQKKIILAEELQTDYQILIPDKSDSLISHGARELSKYLLKISGTEIPVIEAGMHNSDLIYVSPDNNTQYCECEDCITIGNKEGSHSGIMIRFVNNIAYGKQVKALTSPKKYADENPMVLTDGALGGPSFYSNWLGFEGNDMDIIIVN